MSATAKTRPGIASPATPEGAIEAFARAIGAGDLRGAIDQLSADARLLTPDATLLEGREAIRPLLVQLVAMRLRVFPTVEQVLLGGDVALAQGRWRGLSAGPGGERLEQRWRASAVLRLVGERWCLHILSPWQLNEGGSG